MYLDATKGALYSQHIKKVNNSKPPEPTVSLGKSITTTDFLNPKNYIIPFMGTNTKILSPNELNFSSFRDTFCEQFRQVRVELSKARWNFYNNSNDENKIILEENIKETTKLFQDQEKLSQLKQFQTKGIEDPDLKRHLKYLIENFELNTTYKSELETIDHKTNEIEEKNNQNPKYEGYVKDMVELIKLRNDLARKMGYSDYFSYELNNLEVNEKQLFKLLEDLAPDLKKIGSALFKDHQYLSPEELSKYIKDTDQVLKLTKLFYKNMGVDIENIPIKYDLFPRDNKARGKLTFLVDPPDDLRILTNLQPNLYALVDLIHEHFHAIHAFEIPKDLPYLDKEIATLSLTEAFPMVMENLILREPGFLQKELNMPIEMIQKLEKAAKQSLFLNVRNHLILIQFEKEMYKNPDQNLAELWDNLYEKHTLMLPGNEWTDMQYLLTKPVSFVNYFRAMLMGPQLYEGMTNQLAKMTKTNDPVKLLDSTKTTKFLKDNLFKYGSSLSEDQLMTNLTGDTLNIDSFYRYLKE